MHEIDIWLTTKVDLHISATTAIDTIGVNFGNETYTNLVLADNWSTEIEYPNQICPQILTFLIEPEKNMEIYLLSQKKYFWSRASGPNSVLSRIVFLESHLNIFDKHTYTHTHNEGWIIDKNDSNFVSRTIKQRT